MGDCVWWICIGANNNDWVCLFVSFRHSITRHADAAISSFTTFLSLSLSWEQKTDCQRSNTTNTTNRHMKMRNMQSEKKIKVTRHGNVWESNATTSTFQNGDTKDVVIAMSIRSFALLFTRFSLTSTRTQAHSHTEYLCIREGGGGGGKATRKSMVHTIQSRWMFMYWI